MEEKMGLKRKPQINKIILISAIIFICIICLYFGGKIIKSLFWDEHTAKSPYDEMIVAGDNSIVLKSQDLTDIQSEILTYISDWKEVRNLSYINVYLDNNLELNTILFVYQLDDIDNYKGRLEVKCTNEDMNWKIVRAESIYYYDENEAQNSSERQLTDSLLMQKIQSVVKFIESKEQPRLDLYLLSIDDDSIHIDAHNVENENAQNNWKEDCFVYQNGEVIELRIDN